MAVDEKTLERRADFLVHQDYLLMKELVQHRRASGLTQEEVAERMGVYIGEVQNFEAYSSNPSLSRVRRYALAVGMGIRHTTFEETD